METEEFTRRLSAILSADVVGYSRLMRDNEEATVRSIKLFRSAITKLVRDYRGHVVDAPGDNILAEFTSVVDAVNCAVEIQRDLAERNAELPENRKMLFRIGIHLGDIIEEEGRIYGDGVNIAARMESLADAGRICISGTVYDAIEHKLGLEYAYLGEQEVKNIDQPVRAYKVLSLPGAAAHRVVRAKRAVGTSWRNASFFVIAVLAVGLITLAVWNYSLKPVPQPEVTAPVETAALPLPDTPSLAVLPFVDMSRDRACEYLSDGITEDIITTLSKIPRLFVIARESVFEYKGKAIKVQQIGRELGVKHVLQGSVQKEGDRLRISASLANAGTGRQIWAEQYDRPFGDIFALQDDITFNILEAMQVKLAEGEQTRIHRKGTRNMEAYIKVCQGRKHAHSFNREGNTKARQCAEEAVALDPTYAMAHYVMAKVHYTDIWLGMAKSPKDSLAAAFEYTRKAIELDNELADAYGLLSVLYIARRDFDRAIAEGERAVTLAPNSADAYVYLGMSLRYAGLPERAIPILEKAVRLNPFPQTWYYMHLGAAYREAGQYEESLAALQKAIKREPDNLFAYNLLCSVYEMMGREDEARAMVAEVYRVDPNFSLTRFEKTYINRNEEIKKQFIDSLKRAGLK